MGNHSSLAIFILFLFVVNFQIQKSIGLEPCSDAIRMVCDCFHYPTLSIRCSHKSLIEYPDFKSIQSTIHKLDISYNNLRLFPPNLDRFHALDTLDLSHNRFDFIPDDVVFPDNLHHLSLSHNNISNWINLSPNAFLMTAINLETLDLAANPLGAFNDVENQLLLVSNSLKTLNLSDCNIHKITGSLMLSGLVKLEHLILSSNPLYTLPDLQSFSLQHLDVSACKLGMLRRTVFSQMPSLLFVNFSENHRITLVQRNDEYVQSVSLRQIDLSMCNMNAVELKGFPNLTTANLSGNLITELTDETFQNNMLLESLDLSSNAISRISALAFRWLNRIRTLDLSLNMIRQIDRDTFIDNTQLISINLSRNFIDRFRRFISKSITYMNLSRCEITRIDADAIDDLPELIELDLSYNWFNELPPKFGSPLLQILDVSQCRLSNIDNSTFSTFPELSRLNLAGNRLTTTLRRDYFANNQYLSELWLGDNPWRCECDRIEHEFFLYVTERPARLKDRSQIHCYSPLHGSHDVLWEVACSDDWDGAQRRFGAAEKVWTMAIAILIAVSVLYSVVYGVKLWLKCRRDLVEEEQRQENLETSRNLARQNQMILEHEGQPNAPDPRESNPPCYDDAIRMPRLKASFTSLKLAYFGSSDLDLMRRATKRARSEEILGAASLDVSQRPILVARSRKRLDNWMNESGESSMALIKNDSIVGNDSNQKSFEIIQQFETEDGHSPYAKRKPTIAGHANQSDSSFESLNIPETTDDDRETALYQNQHIAHTSQPYLSSTYPPLPPTPTPSSSLLSSFSSSSSVDSDNYIILPQRKSFESHYANV